MRVIHDAMPSGAERARANSPTHNGATDRVRGVLDERGPMTKHGIAMRTGLRPEQVDNCLAFLLSKRGAVGSFLKPNGQRFYALLDDMPKSPPPSSPAGEFAIAGPITIGRGAGGWPGRFRSR